MDQETDTGNDQQKQTAQLVDLESERNYRITKLNKIEQGYHSGITCLHLSEDQNAHNKRSENHARTDDAAQGFGQMISQ
jgi:hypothetical protein